jgi:hypothetical protein
VALALFSAARKGTKIQGALNQGGQGMASAAEPLELAAAFDNIAPVHGAGARQGQIRTLILRAFRHLGIKIHPESSFTEECRWPADTRATSYWPRLPAAHPESACRFWGHRVQGDAQNSTLNLRWVAGQ